MKESIRSSVVKTFDTTCSVTMYVFIPVWTGSCNPDPGIQRQIDSEMKKAMVTTGSEIGGLIGSAILPGIGTVIGTFSHLIRFNFYVKFHCIHHVAVFFTSTHTCACAYKHTHTHERAHVHTE